MDFPSFLKRLCVWDKTHLRLNQNVLAFRSKRPCVLDETSKRFFKQVKTLQFLYGSLDENPRMKVQFLGRFLDFRAEVPRYGTGERYRKLVAAGIGKYIAPEEVGKAGGQELMYLRL